jgi:hypothetical protein
MARHHLDRHKAASVEEISGAVCGLQAQVMTAAHLEAWTRNPRLRATDVSDALWTRRSLVKTSCMRQTLHLIPSVDFPLYIAALRRSRTAAYERLLSKLKVTPKEAQTLAQAALDALETGPLTQQALAALARRGAGRRVQRWLDFASSAFRPLIVQGLICYGPPRGAEVTLVRTDRWLALGTPMDEAEAKRELLRRFLGAYGPATVRDFVKWSGIPAVEAKPVWDAVGGDLVDVDVEGEPAWILARDRAALSKARFEENGVRLLPAFDPFLLAHAAKDHLVDPRFYKRVYRNQGWLSPVVLAGGRVVATWSLKKELLTIEAFEGLSKEVKRGIAKETGALREFLNAPVNVLFGRD